MLPIALGEATKLAGRMLDATKAYDFTIRFGEETDTLDGEGEVIETSDDRPTLAEIEAVLPRFTGPIEQIPPAYSALKIDGKAAYASARAGEAVEMKARPVTITASFVTPANVVARLIDSGSAERECELGEVTLAAPSPKAPTSAASPATSPARWAPSAMSPCSAAPAPGRSGSNRPFRWTFLPKPLESGGLMGRYFR